MLLTISSGWEAFVQFFTVAVIFVLVLGLTYLTTRWTAGFQKSRMGQSNIEIIDTVKLTANKYVQIVRCGTKYLAIAVCKDTVTVLAELTQEDIKSSAKPENEKFNFHEILEKAKSARPKK